MPGDRLPPVEGTLHLTEEADKLVATGAVSLNREVDQFVGSIEQQTADLRKRVAHWIIGAFIGANVVTVIALGILAYLDQGNISSKLIAPSDRIITSQVFMALLGATTVQVGAIMVIIARYLFPGRSS